MRTKLWDLKWGMARKVLNGSCESSCLLLLRLTDGMVMQRLRCSLHSLGLWLRVL